MAAQGFPADLAAQLAGAAVPEPMRWTSSKSRCERKLRGRPTSAKVYFAPVAMRCTAKWLMDSVEKLPVDGRWHAQARGVLRDELQAQQRALVGQVLARRCRAQTPRRWSAQWLARDDAALNFTLGMFADMRSLRSRWTIRPLSVAVRRLAQIGQPRADRGVRIEARRSGVLLASTATHGGHGLAVTDRYARPMTCPPSRTSPSSPARAAKRRRRWPSSDRVHAWHARRRTPTCICALGGDGFMLQTLHRHGALRQPVYGMKLGTVGFLMNQYRADELQRALQAAEPRCCSRWK